MSEQRPGRTTAVSAPHGDDCEATRLHEHQPTSLRAVVFARASELLSHEEHWMEVCEAEDKCPEASHADERPLRINLDHAVHRRESISWSLPNVVFIEASSQAASGACFAMSSLCLQSVFAHKVTAATRSRPRAHAAPGVNISAAGRDDDEHRVAWPSLARSTSLSYLFFCGIVTLPSRSDIHC